MNTNHQQKTVTYDMIRSQLAGLISERDGRPSITWESALVSLIALIKQELSAVSWVGFYRNLEGHLWIGPYQGKLACIHLKPGQGVCGQALLRKQVIVVEDVEAFQGHVACDPLSRSEIVLPVYRQGTPYGVLDLDSHQSSAFDAIDQGSLSELLKAIEPLPDRVSY